VQSLKEEVDAVSKDVERAERSYDLNRAAELKCARIRFTRTRPCAHICVVALLTRAFLIFACARYFSAGTAR
jgi:hypothetical protein